MNENDFINKVKKVSDKRTHRVKNSYGVYDYFKYYRKNRPKNSEYVLTESQYFAVIRRINEYIVDSIIKGEDVILPHRLGKIELRKISTYINFEGGKIKTNLAVDWDKTLKLWYEDSEAYKAKTLIKSEDKSIYKIHYNKVSADYTNKSFFKIDFNRDFKRRLKINIRENNIDAFTF